MDCPNCASEMKVYDKDTPEEAWVCPNHECEESPEFVPDAPTGKAENNV
jgi:hypothetical protein